MTDAKRLKETTDSLARLSFAPFDCLLDETIVYFFRFFDLAVDAELKAAARFGLTCKRTEAVIERYQNTHPGFVAQMYRLNPEVLQRHQIIHHLLLTNDAYSPNHQTAYDSGVVFFGDPTTLRPWMDISQLGSAFIVSRPFFDPRTQNKGWFGEWQTDQVLGQEVHKFACHLIKTVDPREIEKAAARWSLDANQIARDLAGVNDSDVKFFAMYSVDQSHPDDVVPLYGLYTQAIVVLGNKTPTRDSRIYVKVTADCDGAARDDLTWLAKHAVKCDCPAPKCPFALDKGRYCYLSMFPLLELIEIK